MNLIESTDLINLSVLYKVVSHLNSEYNVIVNDCREDILLSTRAWSRPAAPRGRLV